MQVSINGNTPVEMSVPTQPTRHRRAYTCDSCGCIEHPQHLIDSCSLCGGSLTQISGPPEPGWVTIERQRLQTALPPGIGTTLAILAGGAVLWALIMAGIPDGMAECQRLHSFSTCASALLR